MKCKRPSPPPISRTSTALASLASTMRWSGCRCLNWPPSGYATPGPDSAGIIWPKGGTRPADQIRAGDGPGADPTLNRRATGAEAWRTVATRPDDGQDRRGRGLSDADGERLSARGHPEDRQRPRRPQILPRRPRSLAVGSEDP